MPRTLSIQCCFATYMSNTVQIEVPDSDDMEAALNNAIETANFDDGWKRLDYEGPIFIAAACHGASSDPGASPDCIEVPHILTERGQMQLDIPSDARPVSEPSDTETRTGTEETTSTRPTFLTHPLNPIPELSGEISS